MSVLRTRGCGRAIGLVFALSLVAPVACAEADQPPLEDSGAAIVQPTARWSIRLQADAPVEYHGMASFDGAGMGTAGMMYPAFGFAGFVAAVVTHGVVMEAAKQKQKSSIQATADQILVPYREVLDSFSYRELMKRALERSNAGYDGRIIEPGVESGQETVVENIPVFALTQDQSAIVMDNAIAIQRPGSTTESMYRTIVRVVSSPKATEELPAAWLANNGEPIKDESARLVAEALDIAFKDSARTSGSESLPFRTVRYAEGSSEKIERAQILDRHCNRLLIRTLRGVLMSVPITPAQEAVFDAQCKKDVVRSS